MMGDEVSRDQGPHAPKEGLMFDANGEPVPPSKERLKWWIEQNFPPGTTLEEAARQLIDGLELFAAITHSIRREPVELDPFAGLMNEIIAAEEGNPPSSPEL